MSVYKTYLAEKCEENMQLKKENEKLRQELFILKAQLDNALNTMDPEQYRMISPEMRIAQTEYSPFKD